MRSANQDQTAGSILLGEYLGISSARVLRKLSVVKSFPANPMIANCLESRLSAARLQSAGMSLRLVRSPVAPKITMTQGEALGFGLRWFTVCSKTLSALSESYMSQAILPFLRKSARRPSRLGSVKKRLLQRLPLTTAT